MRFRHGSKFRCHEPADPDNGLSKHRYSGFEKSPDSAATWSDSFVSATCSGGASSYPGRAPTGVGGVCRRPAPTGRHHRASCAPDDAAVRRNPCRWTNEMKPIVAGRRERRAPPADEVDAEHHLAGVVGAADRGRASADRNDRVGGAAGYGQAAAKAIRI
jgi:hypothetical protein